MIQYCLIHMPVVDLSCFDAVDSDSTCLEIRLQFALIA